MTFDLFFSTKTSRHLFYLLFRFSLTFFFIPAIINHPAARRKTEGGGREGEIMYRLLI